MIKFVMFFQSKLLCYIRIGMISLDINRASH